MERRTRIIARNNKIDLIFQDESLFRYNMTDIWDAITDIGKKPPVYRESIATGVLKLTKKSIQIISEGDSHKGSIKEASTIAAIQGVKDTARTIPHCHPIPIEACSVKWNLEEIGLRCTVTVSAHWKTGVEMEALCGVNAGLLCAWDMLKSQEKNSEGQYPNSEIQQIRIVKKVKQEPHS